MYACHLFVQRLPKNNLFLTPFMNSTLSNKSFLYFPTTLNYQQVRTLTNKKRRIKREMRRIERIRQWREKFNKKLDEFEAKEGKILEYRKQQQQQQQQQMPASAVSKENPTSTSSHITGNSSSYNIEK